LRVINKAKLLSSNFTVEEQKEAIRKTFDSFNLPIQKHHISFAGSLLSGDCVKNIGTMKIGEKEGEELKKGELLSTFDSSILIKLYELLEENPTNRIFQISFFNNQLKITDFLLFKEYILDSNIAQIKENFNFIFDSRLFYYFKLNKKTITKRSSLFLFQNLFIISIYRKKEYSFFINLV
jgi:hypothetical protein